MTHTVLRASIMMIGWILLANAHVEPALAVEEIGGACCIANVEIPDKCRDLDYATQCVPPLAAPPSPTEVLP